jgi:hypothetical protein
MYRACSINVKRTRDCPRTWTIFRASVVARKEKEKRKKKEKRKRERVTRLGGITMHYIAGSFQRGVCGPQPLASMISNNRDCRVIRSVLSFGRHAMPDSKSDLKFTRDRIRQFQSPGIPITIVRKSIQTAYVDLVVESYAEYPRYPAITYCVTCRSCRSRLQRIAARLRIAISDLTLNPTLTVSFFIRQSGSFCVRVIEPFNPYSCDCNSKYGAL